MLRIRVDGVPHLAVLAMLHHRESVEKPFAEPRDLTFEELGQMRARGRESER